MNTKETRALAEQFNEAWSKNAAKKMGMLVADDVILQYPPYEKTRNGHEEVINYIAAQPGSTADETLKVDTMVRNIHTLVVEGSIAVGFHNLTAELKNGNMYSNEYVWRMTFADGKIVRFDGCLDRLIAIQQVGDKPFFHGAIKK